MAGIDELLRAGVPPVIAILRGIAPREIDAVGEALVEAGIRMIEVPLNSPDPFSSIAMLQAHFGDRALVGGGTVLDTASVDRLAASGAGLVVAPNTDPAVISRALERDLEVLPGVLTPSEALTAIAAGARRLKLFPGSFAGTVYLQALREVLPARARVWAVGGVEAANLGEWLNAGAEGVAMGSSLYRPGHSASDVAAKAAEVVAAWKRHEGK